MQINILYSVGCLSEIKPIFEYILTLKKGYSPLLKSDLLSRVNALTMLRNFDSILKKCDLKDEYGVSLFQE